MSYRNCIVGFGLLLFSLMTLSAPDFYDRIAKIKTLTANFTQEVRVPNGRVMERTSGEMAMERPDKLYWLSRENPKQIIVADGKKLWVYDPELEQVMVKDQSKVLDEAPASLLTGNIPRLKQLFNVEQKDHLYTLLPKGNSSYKKIELVFKYGTDIPLKMIFMDELGQTTTIEFNHAFLNQPVTPSRFKFTVPKGVDVVY